MTGNFYTSDLHLRHNFVANTRGFGSAEEHDDYHIEAFNNVLHKNDHLWILGDVFMGSITEGLKVVDRLKGIKHLVLGNHDAPHPSNRGSHNRIRRFQEVFETVSLHEEHRFADQKILLSHFPYSEDHGGREARHTQWRLPDQGKWLLHGHIHQERFVGERQINVGLDWSPVPWHQDQIEDMMKGTIA